MDLEYGVKRWPQQSNYRTNLEFLSFCSYSRMSKPKPLDPKYYERHAKVKAVEDALNKELELVMTKVAKAEADMTAADASISQNKWSKAAAKLTNSQRLKNVLAEVKAAESAIRAKLLSNTKDNSALLDIVRLQESMEKTYADSQQRQ
jgi:metal-dependent amidase/aminoacylase/carboxypeptidase family protein